ncbi:MAG: START domain-containing protein [Imperialibacter sp.]|uniref:START domain-containing protein n=1 Tax=Imperialibacter sp. TaxID=2038411 RepID=UPI0032EA922D
MQDFSYFPSMLLRIYQVTATLFAFSVLPLTAQKIEKASWELVSSEKELSIYTRASDGSLIKEIQIVTTIESTMQRVTDLLSDVPNYKAWVYKCNDAKRIKTTSANDFHYYVETALPYPFSNRDLSIHSTQWWNKETGVYHSHSVAAANAVPEKKGIVRVTEFESKWEIRPRNDGRVDIVYTALANPGGEIPVWLVNLVITKGPLETMQKFAELARVFESSED